MKNTILHWTSVLLASSALMLSGCKSDDDSVSAPTTPVFPDLQQATIPAGETSCAVTFTPNMDWSASIPTDETTSRWFSLSYGPIEGFSVSGKASSTPVTIYVETISQETFDENPVCEVSLTMGGQTQVIARITRGNINREFSLFASGYDTQGEIFTYDFTNATEVKKYDLEASDNPETAPEGTVTLLWTNGAYQYVFKATSNFEWVISQPDWLKKISETDGDLQEKTDENGNPFTQVRIEALFTEDNIDGKVGVIDFYDGTASDEDKENVNVHNKYYIQMPAFRNVVRHPFANINATFTFNAEGKYVSNAMGTETVSDQLSTTVSSTKGLVFYVVNVTEYGYVVQNNFTKWITIQDSPWNDNDASLFQEHQYTVTVNPNESETARSAKLIALPESLAAKIETPQMDLLNDNMSDFKDEIKPYVYATVEQSGFSADDGEAISINPAVKDRFDSGMVTLTKLDINNDSDMAFFMANAPEGSTIYEYGMLWAEGQIPAYKLVCTANPFQASDFNESDYTKSTGLLYANRVEEIPIIEPSEAENWLMCMQIPLSDTKDQLIISTEAAGSDTALKGSVGALLFQDKETIYDDQDPSAEPTVKTTPLYILFVVHDYGQTDPTPEPEPEPGTGEGGETSGN